MDPTHKKILKAIVLELRHLLEGWYDARDTWHPGDLEQRLAAIGVRRNREPVPVDELPHLSDDDKHAREVVDAYLALRREAGIKLAAAVAEFVRETAYTWANRLLALRCMEARELIDEVILQKKVYGGRSLEHHRLAHRQPELCSGDDDGLFAVLDKVFAERAETLPLLFDSKAAGVALKPTAAALKRCVALLSGTEAVNEQNTVTNEVFKAPDALGWTYQYWNTEEKDRVFEKVRTQKGAKIEGADIIPATQLYTEPYMVKFLVQNSLGATWVGMRPDTKLAQGLEYFVSDADRTPVEKKPVSEITFLDPACGSGHFLIEAFDLFYAMYEEEGDLVEPEDICRSILEKNLYGIDIDERAVQIAEVALWMKVAEKAFDFAGTQTNLVATNIRLPKDEDHLKTFLEKHPEDQPLRPALEVIFEGLEHADELGSLLQIEQPVDKELRHIQQRDPLFYRQTDWEAWQRDVIARLKAHFAAEAESADLAHAFFSKAAGKGLALFDLLARRYDVVAANPPYLGQRNMSPYSKEYVDRHYPYGAQDLYTSFIECMIPKVNRNGRLAFVTSHTFMFIGSAQDLRRCIIDNGCIEIAAHYGTGIMKDLSNPNAMGFCSWIMRCNPECETFCFLNLQVVDDVENPRYYMDKPVNRLCRSSIKALPSTVFAYWIDPRLLELIGGNTLGDLLVVAPRSQTGDNNRSVRFFWEVSLGGKKGWCIYLKGGDYKTFFGNNWNVIRPAYLAILGAEEGNTCRFINVEYSHALTYNAQGQQLCCRIAPASAAFDISGAGLIGEKFNVFFAAALLNSQVGSHVIKALNATVNIQSSCVLSVPIPEVPRETKEKIVKDAKSLFDFRRRLCEYDSQEYSFTHVPIMREMASVSQRFVQSKKDLDQKILDAYGLEVTKGHRLFELPYDIVLGEPVDEWANAKESHNGRLAEKLICDRISVLALLLLSYRWPKQIEANEPIPDWADEDGIIPLTDGTSEQRLVDRVRKRIAAEFEGGDVVVIEREFVEIMGKPLDQWMETEFFKHHLKQFKKRPIAWQIQSGKYTCRIKPAFACLVYYHKLDGDTLPKIRTQYVGPLRQRYETELRGIEAVPVDARSTRQDKRRVELEKLIEELKEFDSALQKTAAEAFSSKKLEALIANEKPDKWCSIDGTKDAPTDHEAFLRQERRYIPDINDGVRVNIAPLQKAGLLAANVLNNKDVDKAIADRAEWRADERRWCREGKFPQPGWWVPKKEQPFQLPIEARTPFPTSEEYVIAVLLALLDEGDGLVDVYRLAGAYSLLVLPDLLVKYAPSELKQQARQWKKTYCEEVQADLLRPTIKELAEKGVIGLRTEQGATVATLNDLSIASKVEAWVRADAFMGLRAVEAMDQQTLTTVLQNFPEEELEALVQSTG